MATRLTLERRIEPALVEHRAAARRPSAQIDMTVCDGDAVPVPAMLLDVSPFGCRFLTAGPLATGDQLLLRFAQGEEAAADVIWREAGTVGCRFRDPVERTLVRRLTLSIQ